MRIRFKFNIRITKNGYLHIPILYFATGRDGFIFSLPFYSAEVSWGAALRKTKELERIKDCLYPTDDAFIEKVCKVLSTMSYVYSGSSCKEWIRAINNNLATNLGEKLKSPSSKFVQNVCLSYRHDYGFLAKEKQEELELKCMKYMYAINEAYITK